MRKCIDALFGLCGVLILLSAPLWYGWVIFDDLTHPEAWDDDWMRDPRIYLPLMAVAFPCCFLLMRRAYRQRRAADERCAEARRRMEAAAAALRDWR